MSWNHLPASLVFSMFSWRTTGRSAIEILQQLLRRLQVWIEFEHSKDEGASIVDLSTITKSLSEVHADPAPSRRPLKSSCPKLYCLPYVPRSCFEDTEIRRNVNRIWI